MFYSTFCFKAYEEYLSMIVNGHVYYVRQRICSAFSIVAYRDMLKLNAGHSSAQLQRERERIPTFILHHECCVRRKGWYLSLVWQFHIMMVNGAWSDFCKQRSFLDCPVCSLTRSFSDVKKQNYNYRCIFLT